LRNGRDNEASKKLAIDAIFVARSKLSQFDLREDFRKYLKNAELFTKGSFIEQLDMQYKQHLPQYKSALLKKRNWAKIK
jgi:hypothetical protein